MGRLRRGNDAPRVVGFDFGPPAAPAAPAPPPAMAPVMAPPVMAPPPPVAAPAPATPVPPPPPGYAVAPPNRYDTFAAPTPSPEPVRPMAAVEPPAGYLAPVTVATPGAPTYGEGFSQFRPGAPAPPQWDLPASKPRSRSFGVSGRGLMGLLTIGVAITGGYRGYVRYFGDPFTTPKTIGTATLVDTPEARDFAEDMKKDTEGIGRPVAGVYTAPGAAGFILVAGDGPEKNASKMFERELRGSGAQGSAPTAFGSVACGTFVDAPLHGTACTWASGDSDGMIVFLQPVDLADAASVAKEAKAAVER